MLGGHQYNVAAGDEWLQGEVPVSIDTAKAEVARRAIELGAELVNDVTSLRGDSELADVVASSEAYLCLMHMQGEPRTMQDDPIYDDVAGDVAAFLEERLRFAVDAGIREERICLDPGFGFGKTVAQNFELLARLGEITSLGRPVLVGLSRKRSLGRILGDPEATTGPLSASIAAAVEAYVAGRVADPIVRGLHVRWADGPAQGWSWVQVRPDACLVERVSVTEHRFSCGIDPGRLAEDLATVAVGERLRDNAVSELSAVPCCCSTFGWLVTSTSKAYQSCFSHSASPRALST